MKTSFDAYAFLFGVGVWAAIQTVIVLLFVV
jgi:hypothetical protein